MPLKNTKHHIIKAYLAIIAGILLELFNGCFFLWANIANYVLSYFYKFEPDIGHGAIFYVDVALMCLHVLG